MERIDVAKLLSDCPMGMELDCALFENLEFDHIDKNNGAYLIICRVKRECGGYNVHTFTEYGCYSTEKYSKCVIFPKGKTTWEGFQRPFKDGDVITTKLGSIFIFKESLSNNIYNCYFALNYESRFISKEQKFGHKDMCRLATEEEKEKLFKAIKDNGYKWNAETKTLEKLIKPKFKVGDWVTDGISKCQIHFIDDTHYLYSEICILGSIESVDKQYHLWTIKDAKDGDVIFYDNGWICIFKCFHEIWYSSYCFITDDGEFHMGYERHVTDSTINGNAHLATKEQCNLLFQKIKEAGYEWNPETKTLKKLIEPKFKVGNKAIRKEGDELGIITQVTDCFYIIKNKNKTYCWTIEKQDDLELVPVKPKFKAGDKIRHKTTNKNDIYEISKVYDDSYGLVGFTWMIYMKYQDQYELVPDKFDITTLKHFDKVLVRTENFTPCWTIDFYDGYRPNIGGSFTPFGVSGGKYFQQCIPYKGNEHLAGTTNDCDEFFKNWKPRQ